MHDSAFEYTVPGWTVIEFTGVHVKHILNAKIGRETIRYFCGPEHASKWRNELVERPAEEHDFNTGRYYAVVD